MKHLNKFKARMDKSVDYTKTKKKLIFSEINSKDN